MWGQQLFCPVLTARVYHVMPAAVSLCVASKFPSCDAAAVLSCVTSRFVSCVYHVLPADCYPVMPAAVYSMVLSHVASSHHMCQQFISHVSCKALCASSVVIVRCQPFYALFFSNFSARVWAQIIACCQQALIMLCQQLFGNVQLYCSLTWADSRNISVSPAGLYNVMPAAVLSRVGSRLFDVKPAAVLSCLEAFIMGCVLHCTMPSRILSRL